MKDFYFFDIDVVGLKVVYYVYWEVYQCIFD